MYEPDFDMIQHFIRFTQNILLLFLAFFFFCVSEMSAAYSCPEHTRFIDNLRGEVNRTPFFRTIVSPGVEDPVHWAHIREMSSKLLPWQIKWHKDLSVDKLRYFSQFREYIHVSRKWSRGLFEIARYGEICYLARNPYSEFAKERLDRRLKEYLNGSHNLDTLQETITSTFADVYACGCQGNRDLYTIYDHGLVELARGNRDIAFDLADELVQYVSRRPVESRNLKADHYLNLGITFSEALNYSKAIEFLSKSIELDPKNRQAHIARAIAYFETNQIEEALQDYTLVKLEPVNALPQEYDLREFGVGFLIGVNRGFSRQLEDLPGSILGSLQGSGQLWGVNLWATNPSEEVDKFTNEMEECLNTVIKDAEHLFSCLATHNISKIALEYLSNNDISEIADDISQVMDKVAPEFSDLVKNWQTYDPYMRGEKVGHYLGKYGLDVCIGYGSTKGMEVWRSLRQANAMCTLEVMAGSQANKVIIEDLAAIHAQKRRGFFENALLHKDKQGKHILGHRNYEEGKSIFTHPNPEMLLKQHAGKGYPWGAEWTELGGYAEFVDFGEEIGFYVDMKTKTQFPTTRGKIHYDKHGGAHIVPTSPKKS